MTKYLASIVAVVTAVLAVFEPNVQAFITGHPAVAAVIASVGGIIAHLLPSPVKPS